MLQIVFLGLVSSASAFASDNLPLDTLKLPKGFDISIYASDLETPRQMALGDNGIVFVGTTHDKVYALEPSRDLKKAKKVDVVASGLNYPNGVAFRSGDLYVAEVQRIYKYEAILDNLKNPKSQLLSEALPNKTWHGIRYIKFGPDGDLYVGIGMPCNTCLQEDPRLGTLSRLSLKHPEKVDIVERGLRNSMGFAWDPADDVLWFTDNGQDLLGDNLPPEELNRAPNKGMNFGFPYFYGQNVPAPHYGKLKKSTKGMTPPMAEFPAHTAPLGMTFYSGHLFPKSFDDAIFVALHGSWNRSKKVGYEVMQVTHDGKKIISSKPFISGWLGKDERVWGRPVDVLVMPDGALLISDDMAGVIYRVSYQHENSH